MASSKNNHNAFATFVASLPSNLKIIEVQNGNMVQRKIEVANNAKSNSIRLLSKDEITVLDKEFEKNMYITKPRKEELAAALNIGVGQIGVWFQNKRRVVKKNHIKVQKTIKENVPPPAATTMTITPKVDNLTQSQMSSGINSNSTSTFKPQIHLALPGTLGYMSHDFRYGSTKDQINSGDNWNVTRTVEPEVDLGLPETWGYTSSDFQCVWTQNHIDSGITSDVQTSTVDCEYDFFADF